MLWPLLLFVATFIYFVWKVRGLEATARILRNRLALCYSDQEQRNKAHAKEIERERALTKAAIDELSNYPTPLDISACVEEMDRLEVEDLLAEIDEENFN
jgi:hypothetical protein